MRAVDLSHYADLRLRRDGSSAAGSEKGYAPETKFMASHVMGAVHKLIVGGSPLAVDFPERESGDLGGTIRLFGSAEALAGALASPGIAGIVVAGLASASGPSPVPSGVPGVIHSRARIEKFSPGGIDRLDRRTHARRKAGKCRMEVEDMATRRREFLARDKSRKRDEDALPAFHLDSASTRQRFPVFFRSRWGNVEGRGFTSYGLSDGNAAVPSFSAPP